MEEKKIIEDAEIRKMKVGDLNVVVGLEEVCFPTPWSREMFLRDLKDNSNAHYFVIERENRIIGYVGFWHVFDEIHLATLAVDPECRKMGVASKLLLYAFEYAKSKGARKATLEVREKNVPAQMLYNKFGFFSISRRKGYYSDTGEDAIIMWKLEL